MSRPSFLVILTDDQGSWTRHAPEVITPAIDSLAESGTEFTAFYCASPVCSPARASILTGMPPSAHGVHDWLRSENSGVDTRDVHYLAGLDTTPQALAADGYTCGHAGKWHLGDARTPAPGFTSWYAHRDGGGPYYDAPMTQDGQEVIEPGYVTDAITEHAVAMLSDLAAAQAPFYLQVTYTAPHSPWEHDQHPYELLSLYADTDFPSVPATEPHPWMNRAYAELMAGFTDRQATLAGYCAALSGADRGVAALLAALQASGRAENTYVVCHADNGFACGHHGYWGKGNGTTPLNAWEPSVLVPFVIAGPGIPAGRIKPAPTSALALHATILDLAGVPASASAIAEEPGEQAGPKTARVLEASFAHRFTDRNQSPESAAVVVCDEYGGLRMIRCDDAKLIERVAGPDELYDLAADPDEQVNLIDDPGHASLRASLHRLLADWFAARCDPARDAWHRPITGLGQRHPIMTDATDAERYVTG